VDIPVEYFGAGLAHLAEHSTSLGVVGGSKGGEAALLVAASYPRVAAAVSLAGSAVLTQGIDYRAGNLLDILRTPVANWTRAGAPLPYLPNVVTPELAAQVERGDPVRLNHAFTLDQPGLDAARIPLEDARARVLLLSAGDDAGYGAAFHQIARARATRHVTYPEAGHMFIPPPYGPTTGSLTPGPGVTFDQGGTPAGTAAAREAAWRETITFLHEHLR
jgi:dienelactone hydrolase